MVWQAEQKYGLKPMGLEALDMVRIEAGLIFANYEFTSETDPFEAGIGFTVPLKTKSDDFSGKAALIEGRGDSVHIGRAQTGVVTIAMLSLLLAKNIALARLDALYSAIGTELKIGKFDGHQYRLPARVVKLAHYDPEKNCPRS